MNDAHFMKFYADVGSDLKVVGYNPENADYTNPRGEIIKEIYYVNVQNVHGDRWVHRHSFGRDGKAAERFATRLNRYLDAGGMLNLTAHWDAARPLYGSDAYAANWQEYEAEEIALERAEEERDYGGGWW